MADQSNKEVKSKRGRTSSPSRNSTSTKFSPNSKDKPTTSRSPSFNPRSRKSCDLKRSLTEDGGEQQKTSPSKKIKPESPDISNSAERALRSNKSASLFPGLPKTRQYRRSVDSSNKNSVNLVEKTKTSKRIEPNKVKTGTCASSSSEDRSTKSKSSPRISRKNTSGRRTSVLTSTSRGAIVREDVRTEITMASDHTNNSNNADSTNQNEDSSSNILNFVSGGLPGPSTSGLSIPIGTPSVNNICPSSVPTSSAATSSALASAAGYSFSFPIIGGTDDDDMEATRLQALLEARGLPPHLFGSLNSRMHQFLQRTMISGGQNVVKAQQLLQGLQSNGDEATQLSAVMDLCQMLVMGNEETLSGFPVKQAVPALMALMKMEHNYEMMNHACRALSYMMDSLPRSSTIIVEAVPVLLEKLQSISCMDVAEQALSALETLSVRHSRSVMQAGGVNAVLTYIDFFSLAAQRSALAIAANCCLNATTQQWSSIRESLQSLSARINPCLDSKCIESACFCFTRLVDNVHTEEKYLKELVSHGLLTNLQQLLIIVPPLLSSHTFVAVIRMLVVMCTNSPDLAVVMLRQNMNETIQYLLVNNSSDQLVQRSPQEYYELVSLIGELMPLLPKNGLFAINESLTAKIGTTSIWQWCDDSGIWHPYSYEHCRQIDAAYSFDDGGEREVNLNINGESYTIDINQMSQMNDDTGTTRSIQRIPRITPKSLVPVPKIDSRAEVLAENEDLASSLIKSLFGILYQIYSCSAGPQIRHKCVQVILRMVYFASPDILREVLSKHAVSSHVAGMLACNDNKVVVNAVQLAHCLMSKIPEVFGVYFVREGVMHQMINLQNTKQSISGDNLEVSIINSIDVITSNPESKTKKTKKSPKRPMTTDDHKPTTRARAAALQQQKEEVLPSTKSRKSFLSNLNPTKWGKLTLMPANTIKLSKDSNQAISPIQVDSQPHNLGKKTIESGTKEKIRDWIRSEADNFLKTYFNKTDAKNPAMQIFNTLEKTTKQLFDENGDIQQEALLEIANLLNDSDASAFEIVHSGLIDKLTTYLMKEDNEQCLKRFLNAFVSFDENSNGSLPDIGKPDKLVSLINRLLDCLHHLEQLEVKVHDMPARNSSRHSNTFRFLLSQQLKCQLKRHPNCKNLHQWRKGPVKVEALATAAAIERYVSGSGFATLKDTDEETDDDNSDDSDDIGPLPIRSDSSPELEILINDHVIQPNMTIYQAIKHLKNSNMQDTDTDNESEQNIFAQTHILYYRPVSSSSKDSLTTTTVNSVPPIAKKSRKTSSLSTLTGGKKDKLWNDGICPKKIRLVDLILKKKLLFSGWVDPCLPIAQLLRIVHCLSQNWFSLYPISATSKLLLEDFNFESSKLTAKAKRQLLDPLVIMTGHLPQWLTEFIPQCPFLLPFETRKLIFCLTTFDRERSLTRLQSNVNDPLVASAVESSTDRIGPRLERKRKTVSRENLLHDAEGVINETAHLRAILEIQYENEVGTGLGPTMEFFSLVSKCLQESDLQLWRNPDNKPGYVFSPKGLFPVPLARNAKTQVVNKIKSKFRFLGRLMAKCLMDSRLMDLNLSIVFYKWVLNLENTLQIDDLKDVDEALVRSYWNLYKTADNDVKDLDLNFTLPGYPEIELKKNGKDISVDSSNLKEYLDLFVHWTLVEGVHRQMEAFREGFESVFSLSNLKIFYPYELDHVFCGDEVKKWDYKHLLECTKTDHGYTHDSQAIKFLFEILSNFDAIEQRAFLQFLTGSPRLPVGGFKSLSPQLTVVRRTVLSPEKPDDVLPSVMTCVNYLKLPDYSSVEIMKEKLMVAANEGQLSFHLS